MTNACTIALPRYLRIVLYAAPLALTAIATGEEPVTISIGLNGSTPVKIASEPLDEFDGYYLHIGEYVDPGGQWIASWNYWINPDPTDGAAFMGNAEIKNTSGQSAEFLFEVETSLCPVIEGQSLLGAFIVVSIVTDAQGGYMETVNGQSVWSILSGDAVARSVFDPPFLLGSSGQGTAALSNSFGSPFPSEQSIPFQDTATLRHQFSMTPGDIANFNTSLHIGADDHFGDCDGQIPGDLNGDGSVDGADLLMLITQWGPCGEPADCQADLNGDGVVDGADLMIMLSNWG
jgi:hypothetical protein